MNLQNLVVYKFKALYHIIEELSSDLKLKVYRVENEDILNKTIKNLKTYLIISNRKYPKISKHLISVDLPINFFKLAETLNTKFLKIHFNNQSELKLNDYIIDINSRVIKKNTIKLKLTEKEINTITYLLKFKKPISIEELQDKVWGYQFNMETHTVETHIYRLRKKILNTFQDNELIISKKNGYQLK